MRMHTNDLYTTLLSPSIFARTDVRLDSILTRYSSKRETLFSRVEILSSVVSVSAITYLGLQRTRECV